MSLLGFGGACVFESQAGQVEWGTGSVTVLVGVFILAVFLRRDLDSRRDRQGTIKSGYALMSIIVWISSYAAYL